LSLAKFGFCAYMKVMSKQTEIFEFADTDLVRKLCGPNHAHLALIEDAFGVYIEAPGNAVHINGDTPSRARAGVCRKHRAKKNSFTPCATRRFVSNVLAFSLVI